MNSLDLVIVLAALIAAVGGWRFGFFARVLTWCGVAVGLLVGVPYVPRVVTAFGGTSVDSRVTVAVLFLVLVATLGHALGLGISAIRHRFGPAKPLARWDRVAGGAIGAVGVVAFVWIMIPSLTLAQGWPARLADTSAIVGFIDDLAPEQPDQFSVVGVEISDAPYPGVPDSVDEPPDPGPPPDVVLSEDVDEQVRRSVVKVSGQACKQTQTGSGWVTTDGLVVTNAHVVAGEHDVGVEDAQGDKHDATVVLFDPVRDLALLDVATLAAPGLELAEGHTGDDAAVYGYPGGGEVRVAPARVVDRRAYLTNDIYRGPRSERGILTLHAALEHGDSGAAVVNEKGAVIGVAFAVVDDPAVDTGLAIADSEVRAALAAVGPVWTPRVGTGNCL